MEANVEANVEASVEANVEAHVEANVEARDARTPAETPRLADAAYLRELQHDVISLRAPDAAYLRELQHDVISLRAQLAHVRPSAAAAASAVVASGHDPVGACGPAMSGAAATFPANVAHSAPSGRDAATLGAPTTADFGTFDAQWEVLMGRTAALQSAMRKFALELAVTPTRTAPTRSGRAVAAWGSTGAMDADVEAARAAGRALLSVAL